MKIEINTQSSIKLMEDYIIYFDPYKISDNYQDADYIFITHNHYDHFDLDSIKKVMKEDTKIIIPDSMAIDVLGKIKSQNVRGVIPNESYNIEGLEFETVPSYNINKDFHPKSNNWCGYILKINNITYYIAGDTDATDELKNIKCDVAFIPIGGIYTMDYQEASEAVNIMNPQIVIPIHYGSIVGKYSDGENFKKLLNENIECKIILKDSNSKN